MHDPLRGRGMRPTLVEEDQDGGLRLALGQGGNLLMEGAD
jgi:hypothetical protein